METPLDIKSFRAARNWSQERLAEELGVNVSTVWRWEKKSAPPKGPVAKAIEKLQADHPVTGDAA